MGASQGDAYGGQGSEILAVSWILMALTTIVIVVRVYVRFYMAQPDCSYKDTWSLMWVILGWLFGTLGTSFLSVAVYYGYGNRISTITTQGNISNAVLYTWIWSTFSILMVVWAKFSVVAYFLEVQQPSYKILRWMMVTLMALSLGINIVDIFLAWFQCDPVRTLWDITGLGNCQLQAVYYDYSMFSGSWSAFVDFLMALYPFNIIYQMRINDMKLRLVLGALVGLGLVACVCACMRTYELQVVQESADSKRNSVPLVLWSIAESWVILIASSIPTTWQMIEGGLGLRDLSHRLSEKVGTQGSLSNDSEASSSVRTSAQTYTTISTDATTASRATTASNPLTLNDSCAGQRLDSAIAVRHEVTIDREARRSHQGNRPRADTRSWARADSIGLSRWSSTRAATSPLWARIPSWARNPEQ